MTIMVDTGAWYALTDASDVNHPHAKKFCLQVAGRERLGIADDIFTFDRHFLFYRYGPQRKRAFHCLPRSFFDLACIGAFRRRASRSRPGKEGG